ncbi:MAG: hypothetical protein V3V08_13980 [Nannocystaceae bacterium]
MLSVCDEDHGDRADEAARHARHSSPECSDSDAFDSSDDPPWKPRARLKKAKDENPDPHIFETTLTASEHNITGVQIASCKG